MWCGSPEQSFGRTSDTNSNKIKNPELLSSGFKCGVGVPNEASGSRMISGPTQS
jgi:hypothetical protein